MVEQIDMLPALKGEASSETEFLFLSLGAPQASHPQCPWVDPLRRHLLVGLRAWLGRASIAYWPV